MNCLVSTSYFFGTNHLLWGITCVPFMPWTGALALYPLRPNVPPFSFSSAQSSAPLKNKMTRVRNQIRIFSSLFVFFFSCCFLFSPVFYAEESREEVNPPFRLSSSTHPSFSAHSPSSWIFNCPVMQHPGNKAFVFLNLLFSSY